jgi:hypothetical protein
MWSLLQIKLGYQFLTIDLVGQADDESQENTKVAKDCFKERKNEILNFRKRKIKK